MSFATKLRAVAPLACMLLAACEGEPSPPTPRAVAPSASALVEPKATPLIVPGSRVSLWLPPRAERVGHAFTYRFERAGPVEVRVAEATIDAETVGTLDASLKERVGIDPRTELIEGPPGSGRWHTRVDEPRQAHVRLLRSGNAAAAVLVGIESRGDLDVVETILDSVTVDDSAPYDVATLLGIAMDPPAGASPAAVAGPAVMYMSDAPGIDGGLTVAWIPAGVKVDDAMLESSLRELLLEKAGVDSPEIEAVQLGPFRGSIARSPSPEEGPHFILATVGGADRRGGFFMVYAAAEGAGSKRLIDAFWASAQSLRLR